MLRGYSEYRIAQQDSYWTAIGAAAGEPPCGAAYQQQRAEAVFCDCRRLGTLAVTTMPAVENSFAASAAALSPGSGTATVRHPAGAGRADRQHSIFPHRRTRIPGSRLGLGARALAAAAV